MQQAIAILDSGVGGLTVVKEVMRQLPQEKIIYFGDTARTPYGPRPGEEVRAFTRQIVDYLVQFQPKMIVIACNTATAVALDDIRSYVKIPVIGVIAPGARAAIKSTRSGVVGVIGTIGTIRSHAYENALKSVAPYIQVYSQACPLFVPLVERGEYKSLEAIETVSSCLAGFGDLGEDMDTLILGCTHYPFLKEAISAVMGPNVKIISSADETAREISTVLYHNDIQANTREMPVHHFFCSGEPSMFKQITENWLQEQMSGVPVVWQVPNFI